MYEPINPLGYSCIKKLQRDNLWHAYNEPINIYSVSHNILEHLNSLGNSNIIRHVWFSYKIKIGFMQKTWHMYMKIQLIWVTIVKLSFKEWLNKEQLGQGRHRREGRQSSCEQPTWMKIRILALSEISFNLLSCRFFDLKMRCKSLTSLIADF